MIAPFQDPAQPLSQPNIGDVAAIVDKFKQVAEAVNVARADLVPDPADLRMDIRDVAAAVDGFEGLAYYFSGPGPCP